MTKPIADPEPGWYVVSDLAGPNFCLRRGQWGDGQRYWDFPDGVPKKLSQGLTLVAGITDLLRDAARYRESRVALRCCRMRLANAGVPEPPEVAAILDAEEKP